MQNWITEFMEMYGYFGILAMIAFENVFPPIPSEVILTFGGFMTTYTDLTVPGVIAAATLGSVVGAIILYGIGRILDVERLEVVVERWGHILRLKKEDLQKADAWFDKYGYWTVLFCRMVPLLRSLISIPAGMSHMNVWLFLLFTTIGSLAWNVALVSIGAALGESWEEILYYMEIYSSIAYAGIALGGVVFLFLLIQRRRMAVKKTQVQPRTDT